MSPTINDWQDWFGIGWLDTGIKGTAWMLYTSAFNTEKLQPVCGVHILEKMHCYSKEYFVFLPTEY